MGAGPSRASGSSSRIKAFTRKSQWKAHMDAYKDSDQLMVIDFTALWCGPCRIMLPVLIELADQYTDVLFCKIDVDELKEVAREWVIEAMPTFVLVKKGKEVARIVGANKDELQKMIDQHRTNNGI